MITNIEIRDRLITKTETAKVAGKCQGHGMICASIGPNRFLRDGERGIFVVGNAYMIKLNNDGMVRFYERGLLAHEENDAALCDWFSAQHARKV